MKKILDLSGLKLILIGFLIEIVAFLFSGTAVTGLMNGNAGMFSAVMAVACISMILAWMGCIKAAGSSLFFKRAQIPALVRAAIAVVLAIVMGTAGNMGVWNEDMLTVFRKHALGITLAVLLIGLVWVVSVLMMNRRIMRACGNIAELNDDAFFSLKCLKTWRIWNIAFLLIIFAVLLAVAIIINVLKKTLQQGLEGEALNEALSINIASSIMLASAIFLVVLIFFVIVHIMYLVRLHQTRKSYHLSEVTLPDLNEMPAIDVEWTEEDAEEYPEDEGENDLQDPEEESEDSADLVVENTEETEEETAKE